MKALSLTLPLMLATCAAVAAPFTTVRSCQLNDGSRISLLTTQSVEGHRFYLHIDGQTEKAFTDMPDVDFVGTIALATCAGHALVFAIRYGPPYLKGVAIRKSPITHTTERIDFAEKALPRWLYLGRSEMQLVVPNIGNEVSSKYLVYRFMAGKGPASEPAAQNTLPDAHGFKVLRLKD